MTAPESSTWDLVIRPREGWWRLHLAELWKYRDLILLFVRRDLVTVYKQTVLGPLWFFIQPLFSALVFSIAFGGIAKIPTDGAPPMLFYLSGLLAWNYFSTSLLTTSNTFVTNAGLFGKVYFPRLCVPVAVVISNLAQFAVQMLLLTGFIIYFKLQGSPVTPNWSLLALPVFLCQLAALGLGFGVIISALTTKYRDLAKAVVFGVQLWMYVTPVVYPLSKIPEESRHWFLLNPMTTIVEWFRHAWIGVGSGVSLESMALSWGITLVVLAVGVALFNRVEKTFMDTV